MGWEEVSGDESGRLLRTDAMTEMRIKQPSALRKRRSAPI